MKDKLQKDMIDAMKNHDKIKLSTIKLLKASIQMEEINSKKELTDDDIISLVTKQIKMRKDAILEFEKANRTDLIDEYNKEIDVLKEYLPKPLSNDEIIKIIDDVFEIIKPESQKDMGKIMKEISPKLKNKADMGYVNSIIKEKLNIN